MPDNVRITDIDSLPSEASGDPFSEFTQSLPEDATQGFARVEPSPVADSGDEPGDGGFGTISGNVMEPSSPSVRRVKMSRKMKKAMDKIKSKVANFPILWFQSKAVLHPEWALDADEKEIIKDSLDFVFEILNIEFLIEPIDITLTSIWWIIAYPISAIGMIFFIKKNAVQEAHPPEEEETK